jgi:hypothetical protein
MFGRDNSHSDRQQMKELLGRLSIFGFLGNGKSPGPQPVRTIGFMLLKWILIAQSAKSQKWGLRVLE